MNNDNRVLETFQSMMTAVNAGDAAQYAKLYAPDAELEIVGGDGLHGRAAIEAYENTLLRDYPRTRFVVFRLWQHGPESIVHYGVNSPLPGGGMTGHEGLLFYQFDSTGMITRERRYLDAFTPMMQVKSPDVARKPPHLGPDATHVSREVGRSEALHGVVEQIFVALHAANENVLSELLAPEVVIDEMICEKSLSGPASIGSWVNMWKAFAPDARFKTTHLVTVDSTVLFEGVLTGVVAGVLGPVAPSPRTFTVHRAGFIEFTAGRASRITMFMNRTEFVAPAH